MTHCPYPPEWFDPDSNNRLWADSAEFKAFAAQVSAYLSRLPQGKALSLARYRGRHLEWVVRAAAIHIDCEPLHFTHFADDYTYIYRRPWPPELIHAFWAARLRHRFSPTPTAPHHPRPNPQLPHPHP